MVDQGTLLGFYGAVWNGHAIRAEPLTPMFDLSTHSSYERVRDQIASSLDAFVECVGTIGEHYRKLDAEGNAKTSHQQASQARRFPYLTSYEIDTRKIHVTFTERLYDSKRLFRVIDDSQASCEYVVKFSKRYSEDAHRFLASKGFAPKLLQCKLIPGGWFAVLMERSAYTLFNDFCGYRELVKQKLTEAIQLLHGNELVHGDIRSINLLVDEGSLSLVTSKYIFWISTGLDVWERPSIP
ncbi:hypothetical protein VNI00_013205 [Paramarasmius palmivorus]|uniref:Non-specific serine/threonine protein kinase n=1 Tax=Paramarasmius palmivorus TaxID=297713 RepID=A0AAW0C0Y7_9AGAR